MTMFIVYVTILSIIKLVYYYWIGFESYINQYGFLIIGIIGALGLFACYFKLACMMMPDEKD